MLLHYITRCSVYLHKYEPWFSWKCKVCIIFYALLKIDANLRDRTVRGLEKKILKSRHGYIPVQRLQNMKWISNYFSVVPHFSFCHNQVTSWLYLPSFTCFEISFITKMNKLNRKDEELQWFLSQAGNFVKKNEKLNDLWLYIFTFKSENE